MRRMRSKEHEAQATGPQALAALLPCMTGKRIMVVGDLCQDEYIIGRAQRLSREAPVPILEFQQRFTLSGAAANPALNINSLGSVPLMVGVVGRDEAGESLCARLQAKGIDVRGIVVDPSRPTTVKTRVLAEVSLHFPQQLVRVDRQERRGLDATVKERIIGFIGSAIDEVDAVLFSDYKSGVVEEEVIAATLSLARSKGKILTVDSQGDLFKFKNFTLVKCNREEAESVLGQPLPSDGNLFRRVGQRLQKKLNTQVMLITRGSDGMSLVDARGACLHIPAANRSEVFDVTGAGDTVIAAFTLALAGGASVSQAAHISNHAAGLVVRRLGNATVTLPELEKAILSTVAPADHMRAERQD